MEKEIFEDKTLADSLGNDAMEALLRDSVLLNPDFWDEEDKTAEIPEEKEKPVEEPNPLFQMDMPMDMSIDKEKPVAETGEIEKKRPTPVERSEPEREKIEKSDRPKLKREKIEKPEKERNKKSAFEKLKIKKSDTETKKTGFFKKEETKKTVKDTSYIFFDDNNKKNCSYISININDKKKLDKTDRFDKGRFETSWTMPSFKKSPMN